MFGNQFEMLERRCMMSVAIAETSAALTAPQSAVVMNLGNATAKAATPAFDVTKIKGTYTEKGGGTIFAVKLYITSVNRKGNFVGKLTLPWIFTLPVQGKVKADGTFSLKYEEDFKSTEGTKGYLKGKFSSNSKAIAASMDYSFDGAPTGKPWKMTFVRKTTTGIF